MLVRIFSALGVAACLLICLLVLTTGGDPPAPAKAPVSAIALAPPERPRAMPVPAAPRAQVHELESGDLWIAVRVRPFKPARHQMTFETQGEDRILSAIDGQDYYGTDGTAPDDEIEAVEICWGRDSYLLAREGFEDLFEASPREISSTGDLLEFVIAGGDGAGGFQAFFEISRSSLSGIRKVADIVDLQEEDPLAFAAKRRVRLMVSRLDFCAHRAP